MKFFLAIALVAAVASGAVLPKPVGLVEELGQLQEIIAAIQSPSVDPATAAMLEDQLNQALGIMPSPAIIEPVIDPVHVVDEAENIDAILPGPAIIEPVIDPVQVVDEAQNLLPILPGPAIITFPVPEEALTPTPIVEPTPAVIAPVAPAAEDNSSPLVQIIVNVKGVAPGGVSPVAVVGPTPTEAVVDPVQVVDEAAEIVSPILPPPVLPPVKPEPVVVVNPPQPEPVVVVNPPQPEPVIVVNPPQPEPVIIGEPSLPIIVPQPVVLPETLN